MASVRTVRIDIARNADMEQVQQLCCDLLTGLYDFARYPYAILVDAGKEHEAVERLSSRGYLSSIQARSGAEES